jgi:transposase
LARADYLPRVWLPDPDTEALRHLFCDRRSLVDRRTELKNTAHAILHRNLVEYDFADLFGTAGRAWLDGLCEAGDGGCDPLDRLRLRAVLLELDLLELSLRDVEGVIAAFVSERPCLRSQLDHLLSIPGVSLVVGARLLAAIGDVRRFHRAKKLAAYFGLVPSSTRRLRRRLRVKGSTRRARAPWTGRGCSSRSPKGSHYRPETRARSRATDLTETGVGRAAAPGVVCLPESSGDGRRRDLRIFSVDLFIN